MRDLASLGNRKIKRYAALVTVQADERGTFARDLRMLIGARVVSAIRVLDLDDLRAEVTERLRAGGSRDHAGEVDHEHPLENGRSLRRAWRPFGQRHFGSHSPRSFPRRWRSSS
jgi:hypothetical protein